MGYIGKVLSPTRCGGSPLAEGAKGTFKRDFLIFYTFHNLLPKNFYKKSEKTV